MALDGQERQKGLTQNQIKMIAVISMVIDHVGVELFPQYHILRILGRIAFPVFSFSIYEGFRYTRNKRAYFLRLFALGCFCMVVYGAYAGELYGNVLITFSLSMIALQSVFIMEERWNRGSGARALGVLAVIGCFAGILLICGWMYVDYGFVGVLLPVFAEAGYRVLQQDCRRHAVMAFALGLVILALGTNGTQWFALAAVPLLMAYNGQRGTASMKYFFYWFYPLHLGVIGLISMVLGRG